MDTDTIQSIDHNIELYPGMYDGDPRVTPGHDEHVFLLPGEDGVWLIGRDRVPGASWNVWDQRGTFFEEASDRETAEEAIYAVIGAPLFYHLAYVLTHALDRRAYLSVDGKTTQGFDLAIENLVNNDLLTVADAHPSGRVFGYILTVNGIQLAKDVAECADARHAQALLNERVEQRYEVAA